MLPALGSWLALVELGWVMRRLDTMAQEVVVTIYMYTVDSDIIDTTAGEHAGPGGQHHPGRGLGRHHAPLLAGGQHQVQGGEGGGHRGLQVDRL